MEDEKKKEQGFFIFVDGVKYEVEEPIFRMYQQTIASARKRAQRRGECWCFKEFLWMCDGICPGCSFYYPRNRISLDRIIEIEADESGDYAALQEAITDYSQMPEFLSLESELLEAVHKAIDQLDPKSKELCDLLMRYSEREVASILGIKRSTVRCRWREIRKQLKTMLKDDYL